MTTMQTNIPDGGINPSIHESNNASPATPTIQKSTNPGASLLDDLWCLINRFVVLPDMAAETLALWIVHTYAFTFRQVTTYIGVVSPEKRCGKTTLLELLGLLANRSLTAANISPSALFRVIQETRPTLLIDEADTFLQGRDELAGILNAGYRKGNAYVVRVSDGKARKNEKRARPAEVGEWTQEPADGSAGGTELAKYSCWCPKVMAAIGRLPDTLADRCIVITMQRKMPGEKCERMRHLDATDYRRRCADFVREHSEAIAQARPEIPSTLNDRAADIWEPLLAIADLAGGEWPGLARQAAQKLSTTDDELTLVGYFLKDLRNWMVIENRDRMLSRDIVTTFNPMHSRPWEDLRRGREINEWWLGHKMSELGIRSRSVRSGESIGKGYLLADIEAAFRRYVPNYELHSAPKPKGLDLPKAEPQSPIKE
jgi:putative DNA primase/helicase